MNLHDHLQQRRDQAISSPERDGIDRIVDDLGLSEQRQGYLFKDGGWHRDFSQPVASLQSWRETLYTTVADGGTVTAAAETIMVPDFSLPANYMYVGRTLKYSIFYRQSTAITTPGTITLRLRWGGVGGVSMGASGAFAPDPTAASTTIASMVEWWTVCRSVGTSGTSFTMGRADWNDIDDATVTTIQGNLNMIPLPTGTPGTATIDTTTAKALSPTYQESAATASMTAHMAILESLS